MPPYIVLPKLNLGPRRETRKGTGWREKKTNEKQKRWKKRIEDEWPKHVSTKKAFQVSLFLKT